MIFKKNKKPDNYIFHIILSLSGLLMSCSDEISYKELNYIPEGEPATVSLSIDVSGMELKTREAGNAGMDPSSDRARLVSNLWVGIYNKSTEKRVGKVELDEPTLETLHDVYGNIEINGIAAYSGECYIVGVANYASRNGASLLGNEEQKTLSTLLSEADTWEKYKSIIRVMDEPSIQRGGNNLIMSGVFQTDNNDSKVESQLEENGNPPTVAINPGVSKLQGRIHLRRLDSYIRVNMLPGANINFTPTSWQIINVPAVAFLHEQNGNAADLKGSSQRLSKVYSQNTYFNSDIYYNGTIRSIFGGENNQAVIGYWFDFYQMENKHTGLENVTDYNHREIEFKENELNTGWYKSLVANPNLSEDPETKYKDSDGELYNNNASFMIITGELDYYIDENNNPIPVPSNTENATRRIAEAKWTIHLGYCDGNSEEEKAKDFNCRRNSNYTYNININGVDNIRVEAVKDGEKQPGAEGIVSDLKTDVYSLDSHYGVVNIALTDNQRKDFTWRIQSSWGGQIIDMMSCPSDPNSVPSGIINMVLETDKKLALPENQFYNWIQIRPTKNKESIAHYPGDPRLIGREIPYLDLNEVGGNYPTNLIKTGVNGVWYLEDLRDIVNYPHPYDPDSNPETPKWYTFFIDEYVWEYPLDWEKASLTGRDEDTTYDDNEESGIIKEKGVMDPTDWGKYVGEPNRKLWLTSSKMFVSPDEESIYNNAIYYIEQESIQTYYSEQASYGIGIESMNESFLGDDGEWNFTDYNYNEKDNKYVYDNVDGLLNQYRFAQTYKHPDTETRLRWDEIYTKKEPGDINGYFYKFRKGYYHDKSSAAESYSPKIYNIREHENEFMVACLSRNRDLNNDGQIGSNEIRWYLPTDRTYTRIILGASSLRTPLFELNRYSNSSIEAGAGTIFSHYAASNKRMTWAEEFASTGDLNYSGAHAGTLRCIRNIGQPTYWTPGHDQSAYRAVTLAYAHNQAERTIEMKYYDNTALRNTFYGPGEYILPHTVDAIDSYAFRKFKYAQFDCIGGDESHLTTNALYQGNRGLVRITNEGYIRFFDDYNYDFSNPPTFENPKGNDETKWSVDRWTELLNENGICRAYHESGNDIGTWRAPNITELGILKLFDDILTPNSDYISCSQEYFLRDRNNPSNHHHRYLVTHREDIGARYPGRFKGWQHMDELFKVRCVKDVR